MEGTRTSTGYKVSDTFINNFIDACRSALYFFDNDRQYYNQISQSASTYAIETYDWKSISKLWEKSMNSLLETKPNEVYFRPQTLDDWIFNEVYNENIYEIEQFNKDDIVVDIGAHSGYFTKLCLDKGCQQIHCFEPEENNFQTLLENLSSYQNFQPYQLAVYKEMGTCDFCIVPGRNTGLHSLYDRGGIHTQVNCVSLDDILSRLEKVSLLKIDTEGSEFEILMNSKLLNKVNRIVGEYHDDLTNYNIQDLIQFLEKNNFTIEKIKRINDTSGIFFARHQLTT
jgi:FkbM family methyltransferase